MDIYSASDLSVLFKSVALDWQKAFETCPIIYPAIAGKSPMGTRQTINAFLQRLPAARKWIGNRVLNSPSVLARTITAEPYESTAALNMFDLADDMYGVLSNTVPMLGTSMAQHPDVIIADAIKAMSVTVGYDGVPVYSTSHPLLGGIAGPIPAGAPTTQSNLFLNRALTYDNFSYVRSQVRSWVGADGKPMGLGMQNLKLMVPPQLETIAKTILTADFLSNLAGDSNVGGQGGFPQTNTLKGAAEVIVNPYLSDYPDNWWLLAPVAGLMPYCYWQREAPVFTYLTAPTDANVFMQAQLIYGAYARDAASETVWFASAAATGQAAYIPA